VFLHYEGNLKIIKIYYKHIIIIMTNYQLTHFMTNLYDTFTDIEGWKNTFREYTCPAISGSILLPFTLAIAAPSGGFVAAYCATNVFLGANVGILARYCNVEKELLEVSIRPPNVVPLRLERNNQGVNYPYYLRIKNV